MIRPNDQNETDSDTNPTPKRGKATNKELGERVFQVAQMLAKKIHKHEIKKYLKAVHGIKARQAESYIARAREYLLERSGRDRKEWIAESLSFLESIIRSEADDATKLQANRDLCNLLGLCAPAKFAPTTPDGESAYRPLDPASLTDAELEILYRARLRTAGGQASDPATRRAKGSPPPNPSVN